jgi:iron-sulfur cluster assembly protein
MITVTPAAAEHIREMLSRRGTPSSHIRLGTTTRGCSGLSYKMEYADTVEMGDEEFKVGDISLLVDAKSLIYLAGTELDYETSDLRSGFVFNNPNQKGACGCGESFTV